MKTAIIGCGNLGRSIADGILEQGQLRPEDLVVTRRNTTLLEDLKSAGVQVTDDNVAAVSGSKLIVVGLKPYVILDTLRSLSGSISAEEHVVVSLATGVDLESLAAELPEGTPIYRAMPNTGAGVRQSMTCICTQDQDETRRSQVKGFFESIGEVEYLQEELMEAATVLGACGIAYVMRFIRAMVQGGVEIGFSAQLASTIVHQTVKGAADLLIEGGRHPEEEIDKVTTPKGCTITGLNEMEHHGFSSALIKGIMSSYQKIS